MTSPYRISILYSFIKNWDGESIDLIAVVWKGELWVRKVHTIMGICARR
jgi:hypothetical protein